MKLFRIATIGLLFLGSISFTWALTMDPYSEKKTEQQTTVTPQQRALLNTLIKKIQDDYTFTQQQKIVPQLVALMDSYITKLTWNKLELAKLLQYKLSELHRSIKTKASFENEVAIDKKLLAQCLNHSWMRLFSTERCGHCQNQKWMFWPYANLLNNTDCDANKQSCIDNWVKWFPTWIDAQWNQYPGTQSLETLMEISSCEQ